MSIEMYAAYVLACLAITLIPGPQVTLIVGNSLRYGARAGLLNVAGTQAGLALIMGALIVGLSSVIAAMGWLFDWLRLAGAAYLVWMGWRMLRAPEALVPSQNDKPLSAPPGGFFLQGLLVLLANPKVLFWFGAFIPQFVNPGGNYVSQILLLGLTAMACALLTDGGYALLAGRAGTFLSKRRARLLSRVGGGCLIGGGLWLALTRAR